MKKKNISLLLAALLTTNMCMTSFAGTWKIEDGKYIYQKDNNSYPTNSWKQIGGNYYYFGADGYMLANTTTPDGYYVDGNGVWVQNNQTATSNYDSAHPLAGVVDKWNLRLTDMTTDYVCSNNVHAMLTNQMDHYYAAPVGNSVDARGNHIYTTQEDYDLARKTEQELYNWFCAWLNSMDFQNMSELQRAQEIKKVLGGAKYDTEYATGNKYSRDDYYTVLIDKKGICAELTMTATAVAKSLGLESIVTGYGNHAWYYIKADGYWYEGNNTYLDLSMPLTEEQCRFRR